MTSHTPPTGQRPVRILTVCLGNHCRSPLAAAVLTAHGGAEMEVRSAGVRDRWVGQPAHQAMITAAARRGYDLIAHRGVHISPELITWADVVLAMDSANLTALRELADNDHDRAKIALYLGDRDVPDPFDRPEEAFDACVDIIVTGARRHLP